MKIESKPARLGRLRWRELAAVLAVAMSAGLAAVPISASAATSSYWNAPAAVNARKSSGQATMNGAEGFATTSFRYWLINVRADQTQISSGSTTGGALANFYHAPTAGAFSGCYWTGTTATGTVGMSCKYRY